MTGSIFFALLPRKKGSHECLLRAWHLAHSQLNHTTEQLQVMASNLPSIKEETEMCVNEEPVPGSPRQGEDRLVVADILDREPRSLGVSQRRRKMKPKATVSILAQSSWNATPPRARKLEHQWQVARMSRNPCHSDAFFKEYPDSFQAYQNENLGTGLLADIDLEDLNGLEIETIRRELLVVSERLGTLEEHDASWRFREALLFMVMMLACIANLCLWIYQ